MGGTGGTRWQEMGIKEGEDARELTRVWISRVVRDGGGAIPGGEPALVSSEPLDRECVSITTGMGYRHFPSAVQEYHDGDQTVPWNLFQKSPCN